MSQTIDPRILGDQTKYEHDHFPNNVIEAAAWKRNNGEEEYPPVKYDPPATPENTYTITGSIPITSNAYAVPEDIEERLKNLHDSDIALTMRMDKQEEIMRTAEQWGEEWNSWADSIDAELNSLVDKEKGGLFYNFKVADETLWALGTLVGTVLTASLVDIENVTDWKAWAIGLVAALTRAVIGFLLSKRKSTQTLESTTNEVSTTTTNTRTRRVTPNG